MNIDPSVHQLMKYSLVELNSSEPYEEKKTASCVINNLSYSIRQWKVLANLLDGTSSETDYDGTSFPGNTFQRICLNHGCSLKKFQFGR